MMTCLITEGSLKWKGRKSQAPLKVQWIMTMCQDT